MQNALNKVGMISLGCTKNRVDSEQALGHLKAHGFDFVQEPKDADILLVNTCGFIESAKEESIEAILEMAQYKQTGNCRLLVVTGCLAQRYEKELWNQIPEIDLILGVNRYDTLADQIHTALGGRRVSDCRRNPEFFEQHRVLTTPSYTCYHKIGDGCDNRCTYCAIPLIRGAYRSRPEKAILDEIEAMAMQGVREHILVSQDTTRYGTDQGGASKLADLMLKASDIKGVDWLRVLYCYPDETNDALLHAMASRENICKYLDLPIQHIDADILRRMNRRGTPKSIGETLSLARNLGFTLRTSIIVGFPGETDDEFKRLMDFIEETAFDRLGAFAFSPEEDTSAALMPNQISDEVKAERLDTLMNAQGRISLARNRLRVGETSRVLVTNAMGGNRYSGRSEAESPETDGSILFTSVEPVSVGSFALVNMTHAGVYDIEGVRV